MFKSDNPSGLDAEKKKLLLEARNCSKSKALRNANKQKKRTQPMINMDLSYQMPDGLCQVIALRKTRRSHTLVHT